MNTPTAITHSWWAKSEPIEQRYQGLSGRHSTEVLIIGAGITGLSTAIELAERGHQVIVCEAEAIGAGTTGASTGHLDAHPEMGPSALIKKLGIDDAKTYTALRQKAINTVANRAGDACELVRIPAYYYSESVSDMETMRADYDAAIQLGLQPTWQEQIPFPRAAVGYRLDHMGRFHCLKYLRRLAEIATELGVKIFEQTLVEGPVDEHPTELSTGSGTVSFEQVVCATHCNFTKANMLFAATPPYQSYAMLIQLREPFEDALFWDNSEPYYYIRRASNEDPTRLIVGGCDHRTGTSRASEALQKLENWAQERFTIDEVLHRWSAELFEPTDGLPMIGIAPGKQNIWVATGLSGVGLTLGTVAGELIADGIEEQPIELEEVLSPRRLGLSSKWLAEQAVVVMNLSERVLPANKISADTLAAGEGVVGKHDNEFMGICRTEEGEVHCIKPICTHLGGVLHWNDLEQTWDCPVHGGRFTADGQRIYGPPETNLEQRPMEP